MADYLKYGDKGARVTHLQRLLNDNPFGKPRRRLATDGDMGPLTCAAVQQMKYRLGYPKDEIKPVAGAMLIDLLSGKRVMDADYLLRRKARLAKIKAAQAAQSAQTKLRLEALANAKHDVGKVEGPNNRIVFNGWWCDPHPNDGGAYCVRAGAYWYARAGSKAVVRGSRWQGCDALLADAKEGRNGVHLTHDPDPGNGFVIDFSGHSVPDHFGLYVKPTGGGNFESLEANATLANGQQGVGYHVRAERQCWFIVFER
jgi:hypothetical protein